VLMTHFDYAVIERSRNVLTAFSHHPTYLHNYRVPS
jgi:hypothetical protein